jgi:hypothetical protein
MDIFECVSVSFIQYVAKEDKNEPFSKEKRREKN